jgi:hypothetical protein
LFSEVANDSSKNWRLKEDHEKVLRAIFEKGFSFQYYELCANIDLRLDDKVLLRKLLDKESGYYFNVGEKIKVLEHLKDDYRVECVFLIRDRMNEEVWEEYLKGLYLGHSGKRNLWSEFKERGINLKMKKGEVFLYDKNNYNAKKR